LYAIYQMVTFPITWNDSNPDCFKAMPLFDVEYINIS